MALPTTVDTSGLMPGLSPPHKSSSGDYFAFVHTGLAIEVFKTSDPVNGSWARASGYNNLSTSNVYCFNSIAVGDTIHWVTISSISGSPILYYRTYDMSTEVRGTSAQVADLGGMTAPDVGILWCSIAVRPGVTGDEVVIAASGLPDATMGTDYQRVDFWHGADTATPSFTGPVELGGTGAEAHDFQPQLVLGTNNKVHAVFNVDGGSAALDFVGDRGNRTISTTNTLSTTVSIWGYSASQNLLGQSNIVSYNDSGTERQFVAFAYDANGSTGQVVGWRSVEDGSDNISALVAEVVTTTDPKLLENYITTVVDGTDLYIFFSGGGTDGVDQDLYCITSADGGDTWSGETEILDAVTVNNISAAVLDSGKIAYLYDDGGTTKYNEYVLVDTVDDLLANDTETTSEVTTPTLTDIDTNDELLANDVESASEITTPALAQVHALEASGDGSPPGAFVDYGTGVNKSTEVEDITLWTGVLHTTNQNLENTPVGTIEQTADRRVSTNAVENASRRFYDDFSFTADTDTYWRVSAYCTTSSDQWWRYATVGMSFDPAYFGNAVYDLVTATNTATVVGSNGTAEQLVNHGAETTGIFSSDGEEWIRVWAIVKNEGPSHTTPRFTINFSHDSDGSASLSQNTTDWFCASRTMVEEITLTNLESLSEVSAPALAENSVPDDLLANDVESASELTTPAITEKIKHTLLADDVESLTETSTVAVGQEHALLANDVQSLTEVTTPEADEENAFDAQDVESATSVSIPALGGEHVLLANDTETTSEVSTPALAESNVLLANDVESTSEVTTAAIGQDHGILADDVETLSEVSVPTVAQDQQLLANDVESATELTTPTLAEVIGAVDLFADDVESLSEVSTPDFVGISGLLADDVQSLSEVSTPEADEENIFDAQDVESATNVSIPAVGQEHVLTVTSTETTSEVSTPAVGQSHNALADDTETTSEVSTPSIAGDHTLLADDVESISQVSTPNIGEEGDIFAEDVESLSEVSTATLAQVHSIFGDDVETTSEVSTPAAAITSVLLGDDTESASEVTTNTLAQVHVLFADDTESASEVSTPSLVDSGSTTDTLFADDVETTSEVTTNTLAQVHNIFGDDTETTSEVSQPALAENGIDALLADNVESVTQLTTPSIATGFPSAVLSPGDGVRYYYSTTWHSF